MRGLLRSFAYRPAKQPSFRNGKCLLFRDKVLDSLRSTTLGFAGGIGALSGWKCYCAEGWFGRGGFGLLALAAVGAIKLWHINSQTMAHHVYLLPDGKQIEVQFLGLIQHQVKTLNIREIVNTTDDPEFELLSEGVKAYVVTLHSGEQFTIDLNAIIPDRKLLGAILKGETVDLRQDQDTISV